MFAVTIATLLAVLPPVAPPPVPPTGEALRSLVRTTYGCDRLANFAGVHLRQEAGAVGMTIGHFDLLYATRVPYWKGRADIVAHKTEVSGFDGHAWSAKAPEESGSVVDTFAAPWARTCGAASETVPPAWSQPVRAVVGGRPVDVTHVAGTSPSVTLTFDAVNHFLFKATDARGKTTFDDYRRVSGVLLPFKQRVITSPTLTIDLTTTSVTMLPTLATGAFARDANYPAAMPSAAATAAPAPAMSPTSTPPSAPPGSEASPGSQASPGAAASPAAQALPAGSASPAGVPMPVASPPGALPTPR